MWTAEAEPIARKLLSRRRRQKVTCLILGGTDTGKTTFTATLGCRLAGACSVAIVDADVGQSHIGPPATVGWALLDSRQSDLSQLAVGGMSFVGDVTPVRHLLQFTAAVAKCCRCASQSADIVLVDTPGFIKGGAACALWWTVQQVIEPQLILALQREAELSEILTGLQRPDAEVKLIRTPGQIPTKSPQRRQSYRRSRFQSYFDGSGLYNILLSDIAIQSAGSIRTRRLIGRLVSLRDAKGRELALGVITDYDAAKDLVVVKAPKMDTNKIRCLVVGDVPLKDYVLP